MAVRNFRLLFSATAISSLGDGVSAVALPWLATLLTRDPSLIGLVAAAARLPWLLLAIPAGVLIDRGDRQRLMWQADLLSMVATCLVAGLTLLASPTSTVDRVAAYLIALTGLAFGMGAVEVVRDNASQTALPLIVAKDDLERANGQMWTVQKVMGNFVGPPLAGVLIGLSVTAPFVVDAVTFGVAALLIRWIVVAPKQASVRRSVRKEAAEGIAWMLGHPTILRLAVMIGLENAFSTAAMTVLILLSQERFMLSATNYGVLMTAGAAGGVLGGMFGAGIVRQVGKRRSLTIATGLAPFPYLVIALASSPSLVAAALFVQNFAGMLWNIVTVSHRQRLIPDELLGRVNSLYQFVSWGMMPIGALCGGWIVSLAEPSLGRPAALQLPYFVAAMGSVLLALYGLVRLRL